MSCLLLKSAHKVQTREKMEENYKQNQRPYYQTQISIPKPNFENITMEDGSNYSFKNTSDYTSQTLYPVFPNNVASTHLQYPSYYIHPSTPYFEHVQQLN